MALSHNSICKRLEFGEYYADWNWVTLWIYPRQIDQRDARFCHVSQSGNEAANSLTKLAIRQQQNPYFKDLDLNFLLI